MPLLSCSRVMWLIFNNSGIYSRVMYFFWKSVVFCHLFDFPLAGHICLFPLLSRSIRHLTSLYFMKPYFNFWLFHSKYRHFRLDLIHKFYKHTECFKLIASFRNYYYHIVVISSCTWLWAGINGSQKFLWNFMGVKINIISIHSKSTIYLKL